MKLKRNLHVLYHKIVSLVLSHDVPSLHLRKANTYWNNDLEYKELCETTIYHVYKTNKPMRMI